MAAARKLLDAHLALLQAEIGEIAGEVGQIAGLAGGIVVIALFALLLLGIGSSLFLGEWLFGSIAWGMIHGALLSLALITTLTLVLVQAPGRYTSYGVVAGVLTGVVMAVVFGANLPRRLSEAAAQTLLERGVNLDPAWAPMAVAMAFCSLVLALLLLIAGWRAAGGRGAIYGLLGGILLGLPLGALLGGLTWSLNGAVALGLALGLIAWPIVAVSTLSRSGFDPGARFRRMWPRETYRATMETREWLERQWEERVTDLARRP